MVRDGGRDSVRWQCVRMIDWGRYRHTEGGGFLTDKRCLRWRRVRSRRRLSGPIPIPGYVMTRQRMETDSHSTQAYHGKDGNIPHTRNSWVCRRKRQQPQPATECCVIENQVLPHAESKPSAVGRDRAVSVPFEKPSSCFSSEPEAVSAMV
jgi:hypothetical protein